MEVVISCYKLFLKLFISFLTRDLFNCQDVLKDTLPLIKTQPRIFLILPLFSYCYFKHFDTPSSYLGNSEKMVNANGKMQIRQIS